jgi:subtilisin family serine protease
VSGVVRSALVVCSAVLAAACALLLTPGAQAGRPSPLVSGSRALAFVPDDPLFHSDQRWYLDQVDAFDYWDAAPELERVRVAVIDSGVAGRHPDLQGRIVAQRSFVGGDPLFDRNGHGTFVAGEIAAVTDNGVGVAGVGLNVDLIVAKVAGRSGRVDPADEAAAIRWAVRKHADVINLSLSIARDPARPSWNRSRLEAEAIRYAIARGVIVVAAAGNCPSKAPCPAGYPAALPGVIGAGAVDGNLRPARFSPSDRLGVDLVAPGVSIVSTIPRSLAQPDCEPAWYSVCARDPRLANGAGTSFAAPLVSAAAALILASSRASPTQEVPDSKEMRMLLAAGATPPASPGPRSGAGLLNIAASLEGLAPQTEAVVIEARPR